MTQLRRLTLDRRRMVDTIGEEPPLRSRVTEFGAFIRVEIIKWAEAMRASGDRLG